MWCALGGCVAEAGWGGGVPGGVCGDLDLLGDLQLVLGNLLLRRSVGCETVMGTSELGGEVNDEEVTEQVLVPPRGKMGDKEGMVLVELFCVFLTFTIFCFLTSFEFSDSREFIRVFDL